MGCGSSKASAPATATEAKLAGAEKKPGDDPAKAAAPAGSKTPEPAKPDAAKKAEDKTAPNPVAPPAEAGKKADDKSAAAPAKGKKDVHKVLMDSKASERKTTQFSYLKLGLKDKQTVTLTEGIQFIMAEWGDLMVEGSKSVMTVFNPSEKVEVKDKPTKELLDKMPPEYTDVMTKCCNCGEKLGFMWHTSLKKRVRYRARCTKCKIEFEYQRSND